MLEASVFAVALRKDVVLAQFLDPLGVAAMAEALFGEDFIPHWEDGMAVHTDSYGPEVCPAQGRVDFESGFLGHFGTTEFLLRTLVKH
jgi:hypothetical protein